TDTCGYVTKMLARWPTDRPQPGGGRNPFVYGLHVRLACAHRLGCITEADYQRARQILADLLDELVRNTDPRRRVRKYEIADMIKYAIAKVAAKTDDEARAELGGHDDGGNNSGGGKALPDGLGPTQIDNAARLIQLAGHKLRYVHAWGKWL